MLLDLENLKTISKTMAYVPEKNQLLSREDLIKAGRTYAEGLKVGSFVKVDSPWRPMHSVMKTASSWPARDALFSRGARLWRPKRFQGWRE